MNKYLILLIISFNFLGCKTENMNNQVFIQGGGTLDDWANTCLLYTSPSPRDPM